MFILISKIYIRPFFNQDSEITMENRVEIVYHPKAVDDYKETISSGHSRVAAHIN